MEVISLQTPGEYSDDANFPHFLLYHRILANVKQYKQTDEKKLILLPDEYVKLFKLGFGTYFILLIILPPQFDILTVQQIKPLYLILHNINNSFSNLMLSHILLKLTVLR